MGPMCFDLGFGPFRWVCASGKSEGLAKSDEIAINILGKMIAESPDEIQQQLKDNIRWITEAASHRMNNLYSSKNSGCDWKTENRTCFQ